MRPFDERFVEEAVALCRALPTDSAPLWGRMTVPQMFAHMTTGVRYSLGKEEVSPIEGGLFARLIAAPLVLRGIVKIPRDSQAPAMYDKAAPQATVDELEAELRTFLNFYDTPGFFPPPHPYFGNIGKHGWARLHIVHLDHHLRQFGAAPATFVNG
ncbi:MAG: DUF1569 domain-containing protein [Candidatus Hydrogenedentes bacterium]|nr:DUF1569 domain-containing protein [Candidatus Hydrogenedentota bacterium]